jgi:hypothetical protein
MRAASTAVSEATIHRILRGWGFGPLPHSRHLLADVPAHPGGGPARAVRAAALRRAAEFGYLTTAPGAGEPS